jgi:hypothetical protein
MTKHTLKQWQHIMQAHVEFAGTTRQFCIDHNIPLQTFYSRRHAMGLSTPMKCKKGASKKQIEKTLSTVQSSQFVKAQISLAPTSITLQTQHAQLSLSTQCDPVWLATLLKGLAA